MSVESTIVSINVESMVAIVDSTIKTAELDDLLHSRRIDSCDRRFDDDTTFFYKKHFMRNKGNSMITSIESTISYTIVESTFAIVESTFAIVEPTLTAGNGRIDDCNR